MRKATIALVLLLLLVLLPTGVVGQEFDNTIETTLPWDIKPAKPLQVIINTETPVSSEKINAVKSAIMSEKYFTKDGKTFYEGWKGALDKASERSTMLYIPTEFNIVESDKGENRIIITLTQLKDKYGNSGYTRSLVNNHNIVNSNITIYDIDNLTVEEITTITRHEFGHALGLGHSTSPNDLMHEEIITVYPFISDCHIDTIAALYDGKSLSHITCGKYQV